MKLIINSRRQKTLPVGIIVPYNSSSSVPTGWDLFNPTGLSGKYIMGAGTYGPNVYNAGTSAVIATDSDGDHGFEDVSPQNSPGEGAEACNREAGADTGAHTHNLSMTYTPAYRQMRLIKSNKAVAEFPTNSVVLGSSTLSAPTVPGSTVSQILSGDNKYLRAGTSSANSDTNTVIVDSVSSAGAHNHQTETTGGAINTDTPLTWAFNTESLGNHTQHPCTAVVDSEKTKKVILTAWSNAAANFKMVPGVIAMYESKTPPPGWMLCDGGPGTYDLRDYFVYIGATPSEPGGANDNTINVTATIGEYLWPHDHTNGKYLSPEVYSRDTATGDPAYIYHWLENWPHDHGVTKAGTNISAIPAYYVLAFIQKA